MTNRRVRRASLALAALAAALPVALPMPARAATTYYLHPTGNDLNSGTSAGAAWRTLTHAARQLSAGDTLLVRGGSYYETFDAPQIYPVNWGTASAPVTVKDDPADPARPIFYGVLYVRLARYWIFDGINVTYRSGTSYSNKELVRFMGGRGWVFRNAEVWNAHAVAAIFVGQVSQSAYASEPSNWSITDNCIHDTIPTNATNLDHNVYVNAGSSGPGVIERNLIFDATNGSNIKLGAPNSSAAGPQGITIRYNTLSNASQNLIVPWRAHDNVIERNILGKATGKSWYPNLRGYQNTGSGNVARNNLGYGAARFLLNTNENSTTVTYGVRDGGGNRFGVSPGFNQTSDCNGFLPSSRSAWEHGRYGAPLGAGDWDGAGGAAGTQTAGTVRGTTWRLENALPPDGVDRSFVFGASTDRTVAGDWNGDGVDTAGVVRGNVWKLDDGMPADGTDATYSFGQSADRPVVGDWNGDGTDTAGFVRGREWYLRGSNASSSAYAKVLAWGQDADWRIVGDWDGDGDDTPGLVRVASNGTLTWYLRDSNGSPFGVATVAGFGTRYDRPVAGDWDGDGVETIGYVRRNTWYVRNANTAGSPDASFVFRG